MSGTPWKDYGLISYISQNVTDLGKTKLHKLVYLIKEVGKVPVGFNFRFYNYGPYSDNLAETLDFVTSLQGVKMNYDSTANMYEISAGENAAKLVEKATAELEPNKPTIDGILTAYGNKTAKELELITTILYANKNYEAKSVEALTHTTKNLKPKFSLTEIRASIGQLQASDLLSLTQ
ncbi:hypothetical protein Geob_0580 [Geotalea daltonii FRC-32]|uniref:Antitoxin SocA-like Panacea domain-containing protein n=1 Tax=Geotalea daltonii (strain DSM 22248 / JCM 15807 / FRC-32) TaxID=316067 RepID=B9M0A9_GEODF|nr:hypothetical protein [Geotalea daltonii]ACM18946.1 hypothetical protein Geob_0580 [Geotalea daltonii FRC-32]